MANYVNNKELRKEMIISLNNNELTSSALNMLLLMVDNIQSKFKYDNEDDKYDCRSHAVEGILTKWWKYKPTYENTFSFFTQMIKNDLYAGWNKLNKRKADFSTSNIFIEPI